MFEEHRVIGQYARAHVPPSLSVPVDKPHYNMREQQQNHKVQEILTIVLIVAFISWVTWLSRPREASEPLYSELWLSGGVSLQSEVAATCRGGIITIDNSVDNYTAQHTPFRLQVVTNTAMAYGYYSLPTAAMEVQLELFDEYDSSNRVFNAYEGTVDLRLEGIYLSTLLRDEQGASIHVSGQTFCSPN